MGSGRCTCVETLGYRLAKTGQYSSVAHGNRSLPAGYPIFLLNHGVYYLGIPYYSYL